MGKRDRPGVVMIAGTWCILLGGALVLARWWASVPGLAFFGVGFALTGALLLCGYGWARFVLLGLALAGWVGLLLCLTITRGGLGYLAQNGDRPLLFLVSGSLICMGCCQWLALHPTLARWADSPQASEVRTTSTIDKGMSENVATRDIGRPVS